MFAIEEAEYLMSEADIDKVTNTFNMIIFYISSKIKCFVAFHNFVK